MIGAAGGVAQRDGRTLEPVTTAPLGRVRVLLVDDEVPVLQSMAAVLEDDCAVSTAPDGLRALELLDRGDFDVVCSDYKMPRMNGLELLRKIRERSSEVGFVLVTGMTDYLRDKVAEQPDGGQFHAVLVKPYDPQQLIESIERASKFAQMRRAVGAATSASKRLRRKGH